MTRPLSAGTGTSPNAAPAASAALSQSAAAAIRTLRAGRGTQGFGALKSTVGGLEICASFWTVKFCFSL
jgi:hypothetical protein